MIDALLNLLSWFIELHRPIYDSVLTSDNRQLMLLGLLTIGGVIGVVYRAIRRAGYYPQDRLDGVLGWILWVVFAMAGALLLAVLVVLIIPIFYVLIALILGAIVVDVSKLFWRYGWGEIRPAVLLILWWVFVFSVTGYQVWMVRDSLHLLGENWSYQHTLVAGGFLLVLSFGFGVTRHVLYEDESRLVLSSWWRTSLRYLHVNLAWAAWHSIYGIATEISAVHIAEKVSTADEKRQIKYQQFQRQIEQKEKVSARTVSELEEQVKLLNRHVKSRDNAIKKLRGENAKLNQHVDKLSAEIGRLSEQNEQLQAQWLEALKQGEGKRRKRRNLNDLIVDEDE